MYKQAKGEVQKKINQYRSSLGGSSTQTPTDQTTSNTTTESTEGDNSSGSTTESNVDDSDDNDSGGKQPRVWLAELQAEYQGFIAWYSLTTHHKRDRGDPTDPTVSKSLTIEAH